MRGYILDVAKRWEALGRIDRPGGRTLLDLVKAHPAAFDDLSKAADQAVEGGRLEAHGGKTGRKLLPVVANPARRHARRGERRCDDCEAASIPDRKRCVFHLQAQRTRAREWYRARVARPA